MATIPFAQRPQPTIATATAKTTNTTRATATTTTTAMATATTTATGNGSRQATTTTKTVTNPRNGQHNVCTAYEHADWKVGAVICGEQDASLTSHCHCHYAARYTTLYTSRCDQHHPRLPLAGWSQWRRVDRRLGASHQLWLDVRQWHTRASSSQAGVSWEFGQATDRRDAITSL